VHTPVANLQTVANNDDPFPFDCSHLLIPTAVNLLHSLSDLPTAARGGAVSIGNFDGVHRGHAQLVEQLCRLAARCQGPAVVFTFEPHPSEILRPHGVPPPLSWLERKTALLGELGVEWVIAYPTDMALLSLEPREFFEQIVREGLEACAMVEGPNFHFGKARAGNIDSLEQYCRADGIQLEVAQPQQAGEDLISSSRIRKCLTEGDVTAAAAMLGRPHRIRGRVQHGAERGRTIGFPTANLGEIDCLLPADGVYACRANVNGKPYAAAVNVGTNPTFADGTRKVEAHLLDFAADIYDQPLEIDFVEGLRGVVLFDSVDDLKQQLKRDVASTREILARRS
jgi:riboflavin kinase/FMN adenylyltransferase